jgi:hypothetical protein
MPSIGPPWVKENGWVSAWVGEGAAVGVSVGAGVGLGVEVDVDVGADVEVGSAVGDAWTVGFVVGDAETVGTGVAGIVLAAVIVARGVAVGGDLIRTDTVTVRLQLQRVETRRLNVPERFSCLAPRAPLPR